MATDKFLLTGSFITMIEAVALNWEFWGKTFAIYSLTFLSLGLIFNIKGVNK